MTRKDFQLIADCFAEQMRKCIADRDAAIAIRDISTVADYQASIASVQTRINTLHSAAHDMAGRLDATNERFDRARFLNACGV